MKTIKIGFSKPKGFKPVAKIIQLVIKKPYNHVCYMFYSENLERHIVYEAVGSGIRFVGLNLWSSHATLVKSYDIEVTPETYKKIMQVCVDYSGQDYGFVQNIGVLVAQLFNLEVNPFPKYQNCSELIARVLQNDGFEFDKDLDLVTPADIELAILKKNYSENET